MHNSNITPQLLGWPRKTQASFSGCLRPPPFTGRAAEVSGTHVQLRVALGGNKRLYNAGQAKDTMPARPSSRSDALHKWTLLFTRFCEFVQMHWYRSIWAVVFQRYDMDTCRAVRYSIDLIFRSANCEIVISIFTTFSFCRFYI